MFSFTYPLYLNITPISINAFLIPQHFSHIPTYYINVPSAASFSASLQSLQHQSNPQSTILIVRSYFYSYNNILSMTPIQLALAVLLMASVVNAVAYGGISNVDQYSLKPIKKGLTYQATVWPTTQNNWVGRFSCNNCNPFEGDQLCNKSLPILCLTSPQKLQRPLYQIAVEYTPFAVTDGGYYDGWTGGVFQVTVPVRGYDISSYKVGDDLCKGYFGVNSKFAQFDDGYYMPYMNQRPASAWNMWDWKAAKKGGWNFWGYFNHHYRGRAWVWINGQPNGNCGN